MNSFPVKQSGGMLRQTSILVTSIRFGSAKRQIARILQWNALITLDQRLYRYIVVAN